MSLHLCAAILHQGRWQYLTAIQRGLKASGGDTDAPCISKYYSSLVPLGNISASPLAVLFVSFSLIPVAVSPSQMSLSSLCDVSFILNNLSVPLFTNAEQAYVHWAQAFRCLDLYIRKKEKQEVERFLTNENTLLCSSFNYLLTRANCRCC